MFPLNINKGTGTRTSIRWLLRSNTKINSTKSIKIIFNKSFISYNVQNMLLGNGTNQEQKQLGVALINFMNSVKNQGNCGDQQIQSRA